MPEYYPVIEVDPDWMLDPESMGTKQKFWYSNPADDSGSTWLFKYPRRDSGEHWAEKIAAEIAQLLTIPHGHVELAVCEGIRGTTTESFVSSRETLMHGNELLGLLVDNYNPGQRRRPTQHNLDTIFLVLQLTCEQLSPDLIDTTKAQFASYLILDALIGNTDRHHENWGVLLDESQENSLKLAPSFDHASSLGRELSDERRRRHLAEQTIGNYAARARGGIFESEDDNRRPGPLELACQAIESYADVFRPGLEELAMLEEGNILEVLNRVPEEWMTDPGKDFAVAMMRNSLEQLGGLI
ncbi:MAG: hypothetical protein F4X65_05860 [Chloroflexi bacterium]|nr:hypothetical protein [Chloroflexota bacterium]